MNFVFSEEQDMLRALARDLMAERYPIERIAAIADGAGFDRSEWAWIVDVGWTGISVPEDEGGAGLGFVEEIVLAEELGRALYPGPFLSSIVLALPALRMVGASDLAAAVVGGERIATVAWTGPDGVTDPAHPAVEGHGDRLPGTWSFVPDLPVADLVVMPGTQDGRPGLWGTHRDRVASWRELPVMDTTRRQGEVVVDGAQMLGAVEPSDLEHLRDRGLAALAAEACGVASRALEMAVEHARGRIQFGRPIGAYQAVSHQLAQAFLELETARSLVYWAGWAVAEADRDAPAAAAAAKARASEAAVVACERAIQIHGGIGFTWEHPLHRLYKRALGTAALGGADELWSRVAAEVLVPG